MAKIEQELLPFSTPNYVLVMPSPGRRQDGISKAPAIPLRHVPEDVLLQMCEDFKNEIMRKHRAPADDADEN